MSLNDPLGFLLAGKAVFTVENEASGNRITYKVTKADKSKPESPWFVGVLTGSDNENSYSYAGCLWSNDGRVRYTHGRKSRMSEGALSVVVFRWLIERLTAGRLPATIKICHEGKCGRCGKTLTVPESIESGFGPECVKVMGRRTGSLQLTA